VGELHGLRVWTAVKCLRIEVSGGSCLQTNEPTDNAGHIWTGLVTVSFCTAWMQVLRATCGLAEPAGRMTNTS
jgi:hypothetical protein